MIDIVATTQAVIQDVVPYVDTPVSMAVLWILQRRAIEKLSDELTALRVQFAAMQGRLQSDQSKPTS